MSAKSSALRQSRSTGIHFENDILDYLERLRQDSPLFRRRSRSEIVNMIIEEHASKNGAVLGDDKQKEARQA